LSRGKTECGVRGVQRAGLKPFGRAGAAAAICAGTGLLLAFPSSHPSPAARSLSLAQKPWASRPTGHVPPTLPRKRRRPPPPPCHPLPPPLPRPPRPSTTMKSSLAGPRRAKVRLSKEGDQGRSAAMAEAMRLNPYALSALCASPPVFAVPETHSWFHHLASPSSRKSSLDLLTLGSMGLQMCVSLSLPPLEREPTRSLEGTTTPCVCRSAPSAV
jgi:hypothetical protein